MVPGFRHRVLPALPQAIVLAAALGALSCGLAVSFDRYDSSATAATFALHGSVAGLERASVSLRVNGGAPTVVGNGDFALDRALVDETDYALTAEAPLHTCALEHGSGHVVGADVVGVIVRCSSSDAGLTSIALTGASVTPPFDENVHNYNALVRWQMPRTSVTVTTRSPTGTYVINDSARIASGTPSAPYDLLSTLALDIDGIASDGTRSSSGYVLALRRNDYLKASNTRPPPMSPSTAGFGTVIAMAADGRTIAIAAPNESSVAAGVDGNASDDSSPGAGAVYVFVRSDLGWTQEAYLKAFNNRLMPKGTLSNETLQFGSALAISGDGNTLAVGAVGERSSATGVNGDANDVSAPRRGAAYVFKRVAGKWSHETYFKGSAASSQFGASVALSSAGDRLAVGAPFEQLSAGSSPYAGAVYVFARAPDASGPWVQEDHLSDTVLDNDRFGSALAMNAAGTTLAVGAPHAARTLSGPGGGTFYFSNAGSAYVFVRSGALWSKETYLQPLATPPVSAGMFQAIDFGASVALSANGDTLAVGAPNENSAATGLGGDATDTTAPGAGAAFLFSRSAATWSQDVYVKAPNTRKMAGFGSAVALSADGRELAVGSPGESSAARGLDGDAADTNAPGAGALYVFARSAAWSQRAYLKASTSQADSNAGRAVAVSADGATIAIGAPHESSNAKGVNGDQSNAFANGSGAAYVF